MNPSRDAEVGIAAAEAGAEVLRRRYGGPLTQFAKSGLDFATEADLEAEQVIAGVIRSRLPDDAFLGEEEEGGVQGAADALRVWLVDPLCGTLNFAARTPLASANVALSDDGRITAAAVADPFASDVFWTDGAAALSSGEGLIAAADAETHAALVDVIGRLPQQGSGIDRTTALP